MAVMELSRNYDTRYCLFYIDSPDDIDFLPTSKKSGKYELLQFSPCCSGSIARDKAGKKYVLNGEDMWTTFTTGSGEETGIEIATDDEVDKMLDEVFSSSIQM